MLHRPQFDPSARYVAARSMAVGGRIIEAGEELAGVPDRLARRLYNLRRIAPVGERPLAPQPEPRNAGKKKEKP